jgi:hypothetical protein
MTRLKPPIYALLLIFAVSCAGTKVRNKVLAPALTSAWKNVAADCEMGIRATADAQEDEAATTALMRQRVKDFASAISAKDVASLGVLRASWASLRPYAERGITERVRSGEISAPASQLGLERVKNFEAALLKLTERPR